jgi:predicted nucleotidyltransferase
MTETETAIESELYIVYTLKNDTKWDEIVAATAKCEQDTKNSIELPIQRWPKRAKLSPSVLCARCLNNQTETSAAIDTTSNRLTVSSATVATVVFVTIAGTNRIQAVGELVSIYGDDTKRSIGPVVLSKFEAFPVFDSLTYTQTTLVKHKRSRKDAEFGLSFGEMSGWCDSWKPSMGTQLDPMQGRRLMDVLMTRIAQSKHALGLNPSVDFIPTTQTVSHIPNPIHNTPLSFFSHVSCDAKVVVPLLVDTLHAKLPSESVLLFVGLVGSRRYGLHHANSDLDFLVVYAAPLRDSILSVDTPPKRIKNPAHASPDLTIIEARYFAQMLLSGDPRMYETLYCTSDDTFVIHDTMQKLLLRRNELYCIDVVRKYLSDATGKHKLQALEKMCSQVNKSGTGTGTGTDTDTDTSTDTGPGASDIENVLMSVSTRKLFYLVFRLLYHCKQVLEQKQLTLRLPQTQWQLVYDIRYGQHWNQHIAQDLLHKAQDLANELQVQVLAPEYNCPGSPEQGGRTGCGVIKLDSAVDTRKQIVNNWLWDMYMTVCNDSVA